MGLPPDRVPDEEDWTWLNALAGRPEPGTEKHILRETALLGEALRELLSGSRPPPAPASAAFVSPYEDTLRDWTEDSAKSYSYEPSFSASYERIDARDLAGSKASASPPPEPPSLFPEPSGPGFQQLKQRLRAAGLL